MNNVKKCEDCGPLPVNHIENWINDLLDHFFSKIDRLFSGTKIKNSLEKVVDVIIEKIFEPEDIKKIDRSKVYNRTLVLLDLAEKRGIKSGALKLFGRYNNHFFIQSNGKQISFEGLPYSGKIEKKEGVFIDDKSVIKKILKSHEMPFIEGRHFWRYGSAKKYAERIGFPIVIKPRSGSISRHTFLNVNDHKKLKESVSSVKKMSPSFMVEKYLDGCEVFRATLVGYKLGGIVKRMPANVVGDGIHKISELIEEKNKNPMRGEPKQKDCTFLKLVFDETSKSLLQKQEMSIDSIPQNGQRVFIQEKVILDLGADLIEVTDIAHKDNISLFENCALVFGSKIIGIDFLCEDISTSWKNQKCAIMELNSLPFIDMHHFPIEGKSRNIAELILDMIESENKQ